MKEFPSKQAILDWVRDNPGKSGKRDIARAFGIKGAARTELKVILREMQAEGMLARKKGGFGEPGALPPVMMMVVNPPDDGGDLTASPTKWDEDTPAPMARIIAKPGFPSLAPGDRILSRITETSVGLEARPIKKIGAGASTTLGIFRLDHNGGRVIPVDKKSDKEWVIGKDDMNGAQDGELVEIARSGGRHRMGLPRARVVARLGDPMAPKSISLIAIHQHGIPHEFPDHVIAEAETAAPVDLGQREDLRHLPLFTIDPSDARDHDDAICALPDPDPANEGGHLVWVAIADVAHYVRPGSALDQEARMRGNSSYFPDRVVPMLPDALSGDLCSLHEGVDRPCIAVEIRLDTTGEKIGHRFVRGLMRSPASLSYEQAQNAADGAPDAVAAPLMEAGITPLWAAYTTASKARVRRAPLNLDLPERKIVLDDDGQVISVNFRDRFDAHKLVEEFMILANVCAAETLEEHRRKFLYRVHEEPSREKIEALRKMADSAGLSLAKGQVLKTAHINRLLAEAAERDDAEAINITVLRSMSQAYYAPENFGHFGLNLKRYAHFTSPIRRYADLIVHRALVTAHGWGDDGITAEDEAMLKEIGEGISETERRSMMAERDTTDRYLSAYLADRVGNEFDGRVAGVAAFGLFVKLTETGADGLVPVSTLGREYFTFDEGRQQLVGDQTGARVTLGDRVTVRLTEAVPVTGGLAMELLTVNGKPLPRSSGSSRKSAPRRKVVRRRRKSK